MRMCPGGQEPYALLVWRGGKRWAWLYRLDLARPSRTASPAQLNALDKAMEARRTCQQCGRIEMYCIPTSDGRCNDCMTAPRAPISWPSPPGARRQGRCGTPAAVPTCRRGLTGSATG
ncbi:RRQRL motif-containing zinc-binding protein [Kribbella sp. NPDC002412]